jgi:hypothetical protein
MQCTKVVHTVKPNVTPWLSVEFSLDTRFAARHLGGGMVIILLQKQVERGKGGGRVRPFYTFFVQPCMAQLPCTTRCQWHRGPGSTRACQTQPAATHSRASLDTDRLLSHIHSTRMYHVIHCQKTPPWQPGPIWESYQLVSALGMASLQELQLFCSKHAFHQ